MKTYKLTIEGHPRTKKNSNRVYTSKRNGKPFVMPSKAYSEYEASAKTQLAKASGKPRKPINGPVEITVNYYMGARRRVDLTNLLEATDDLLTRAGVIADDNCRIIISHDGSRVHYDHDNPRAEITIKTIDNYVHPYDIADQKGRNQNENEKDNQNTNFFSGDDQAK